MAVARLKHRPGEPAYLVQLAARKQEELDRHPALPLAPQPPGLPVVHSVPSRPVAHPVPRAQFQEIFKLLEARQKRRVKTVVDFVAASARPAVAQTLLHGRRGELAPFQAGTSLPKQCLRFSILWTHLGHGYRCPQVLCTALQ